MGRGVEYFDKKFFSVIQKNFALSTIALSQIIAIKGNNITFPFEGHYAKIL
jgi:hypothetical protein